MGFPDPLGPRPESGREGALGSRFGARRRSSPGVPPTRGTSNVRPPRPPESAGRVAPRPTRYRAAVIRANASSTSAATASARARSSDRTTIRVRQTPAASIDG